MTSWKSKKRLNIKVNMSYLSWLNPLK
jgi:hypothetical protein